MTLLLALLSGCAKPGAVLPLYEVIQTGDVSAVEQPSMVWQLERDGKISHLMGTCHLPFPLEERVDPRLVASAAKVVVEVDVSETPQDLQVVLKRAFDSDNSVSTQLGRADFARLARMPSIPLPPPILDRMDLSMVAMTIGLSDVLTPAQRRELDAQTDQPSVDAAVIALAKFHDVPVVPLETATEQIGFFDHIQVDWKASIFPTDEARTTAQSIAQGVIDACTANDIGRLPPGASARSPMNDVLLVERNANWIPKLLPLLDAGDTFIAVGALHLVGPDGLLELLKDQGVRATPIRRMAPLTTPTVVPLRPAAPTPKLIDLDLRDSTAREMAEDLCAEGELVRTCLAPDAAVCTATLRKDLELCIDANFEDPTALRELTPAALMTLKGCGTLGLITSAMVRQSVPDTPACAAVNGSMPR